MSCKPHFASFYSRLRNLESEFSRLKLCWRRRKKIWDALFFNFSIFTFMSNELICNPFNRLFCLIFGLTALNNLVVFLCLEFLPYDNFYFSRNTLKAMMPGRGSLSVLKMAVITATSNDNDALKKSRQFRVGSTWKILPFWNWPLSFMNKKIVLKPQKSLICTFCFRYQKSSRVF